MKILKFEAENLKRLVAVEISPDGGVVEITGKNGQGKTSILDAIWWAIAGASHIQAKPIREGAHQARIFLDLGHLKVTRRFTAKDDGSTPTSIIVETEEGARFPSPQKVLDDLIGALSFDPLAFTRMSPKQQLEILKGFVSDFDFDAVEAENKRDFDQRAILNKEIKSLTGKLHGVEIDDLPESEINVEDLVDQLADLSNSNSQNDRMRVEQQSLRSRADALQENSDNRKAEIEALRQQIEAAKREIEQLEIAAEEALKQKAETLAQADAMEIPEDVDASDLRVKINEAREHNSRYAERKRYLETTAELKDKTDQSEKLTAAIAKRNEAKINAIKNAKVPVDGLSMEGDALTLNSRPFDQASDAEQLRTSIAIASAMNPKLRVIRVRDGSLLDDDGMDMLRSFAEQYDLQIWIERVENSGKIGFVIEDGQVVKTPAGKVAE